MEKQQKCKRKKALCDGRECKKCCLQGDDGDGGSRKDDQGSDSVAFGNVVTIKTTRGTTFDYYDSDACTIEKLLTEMYARGILPKDILKVQVIRDGTPSIFTIVLNGRPSRLAGRARRMRVACKKPPYSKDVERSRYNRKAVRRYRNGYKGDGKE